MNKAELRKAAIVLASLDLSVATAVCRHMSEVEAETIINEMAALDDVTSEEQQEALAEFREQMARRATVDGTERAEQLMSSVLGRVPGEDADPRRQAALQRVRALNSVDAAIIYRMLEHEDPQMAAVVLGQLSAAKAAQVVRSWPPEQRADMALRVARLGRLAPGVVEAIGEVLSGHPQRHASEGSADRGIDFLVNLLEDMDRASSKTLLEEMRDRDEELADEVEERLFTFEKIAQLPDESLQALLRAVENSVMARALKGADDAIMERIVANLSTRGEEMLNQEIELLGPVLLRDVEAAQREVVRKAIEMEEAGEIELTTEEGAYVE
ncbi:MAG: hypothetical protein J7M38_09090 [Armatimonadetes bacterium]|nr:hypothetical protein [Armatimonadota bacterium]